MPEQTTTEIWTYAGRRISGGKLIHEWNDARGTVRHFTGSRVKGSAPGQRYEINVAIGDDGRVTVHGNPVYHSGVAPSDDGERALLAQWTVEDLAAAVLHEGRRRAKKDAEGSELQDALDVIRRHYHAARSWSSRSAFIAYVTDQMTLPPERRS
jgi:hypothetical protein